MKRWMPWAALGAALLVLTVANAKNRRTGGTEVRYVEAKKGEIVSRVQAEGEIAARNQIDVGSEVMGEIVKIWVEQGDTVDIGDTLFAIRPGTYQSRVYQSRSQLKATQARLAQAAADYERSQALYDGGLISKSELEASQAAYESLKAQASADRSVLSEMWENYSKTVVLATIAGEVVAVNKEAGEQAVVGTVNTPGSTVLVVADMSEVLVKLSVDETEIVLVEPGQEVDVEIDAYPDSTFKGVVESLGGVPEGGLAAATEGISYPVEVRLTSVPSRLYPGMTATAKIVTGRAANAVVVPLTALGREKVDGDERDIVYVVEDGVARLRLVTLGVQGERKVQVLGGVEEGELVITGPYSAQRQLNDGQSVKAEKAKEGGKGTWKGKGRKGDGAD